MFRFSLQKVLDYRAQLEEQAKMELAKALHIQLIREKAVRDLHEVIAVHAAALEGKTDVTPADLWLWRVYKERLEMDIRMAEEDLRQAAAEVARRRETVVARSTERKLLDKLKSNQAIRHAREESLKEQKQNDEMAVVRHGAGHGA
ncbi:flagellar export protein FliJ [Desulfovibrio sulfodismutans]|uniref:Flagellar FliJ protein n=1 Tax=Desulfolutivibrio sulfodismutans TaxID=63561 RepID=A0A7K3NIQ1_9BACT|nr:flagellar export protein FliJ [Desulfolutivibrio sulfodismutans]NDY56030.1 flagellar export protein FliJ [Desulfolutivibrio sulfodismutans]QLA13267.1 flagellar export protein FliJ [Desulfolutivibrio sulfodismutans DSM 3696]